MWPQASKATLTAVVPPVELIGVKSGHPERSRSSGEARISRGVEKLRGKSLVHTSRNAVFGNDVLIIPNSNCAAMTVQPRWTPRPKNDKVAFGWTPPHCVTH